VSSDDTVSAPAAESEPRKLMVEDRVPTADCRLARAAASLFNVAWSFCKAVTGTWAICCVRVSMLCMSDEYLLTPVKVCGFAIRAKALATEEEELIAAYI
jgi:hypothetical protein